jgi:hypothetical protein
MSMRLPFIYVLLASLSAVADPSDAGAPACPQQVLSGLNAWQGSLSFLKENGQLTLRYRGPMESDIGRFFALKLAVQKKKVLVTIAAQSKPISPEGITMPAEGNNYGQVGFPPRPAGRYQLELRQGAAVARYALTLGEDVTLEPRGAIPPALTFSALEWKHTPADAALIQCTPRQGCGNEVCGQLMRSELLRALPKVDDGAYFTLANSDSSCAVHLDSREAPALRERLAGFDDAGCARLTLWTADAGTAH